MTRLIADEHPGLTLPILRRDQRLLDCELTADELQSRGAALAAVVADIATEEDRQQAIKEQLRARVTELVSRQTALAATINRKKEIREVEVVTYADLTKTVAHEVRADTGEVLLTRPLGDKERQRPLPGVEAPPA